MAMNDGMIGMESLEAERADTMARLRESREEFRVLEEKKLLGQEASESRYAELKGEIERLARRHSELSALLHGEKLESGKKNPFVDLIDRVVDYKMYIFWGVAVAAVFFLMNHLSTGQLTTEEERAKVQASLGAGMAQRMQLRAAENQDRVMRQIRMEAERSGMPMAGHQPGQPPQPR